MENEKIIKKKFGRFYTPLNIVELMVSKLPKNKDINILEPGCGDGRFFDALIKRDFELRYIHGIDIDEEKINLISKKYPNINLTKGSFLSNFFDKKKFDIIIGNEKIK